MANTNTPLLPPDQDERQDNVNESDEVFLHAHRDELDRGMGALDKFRKNADSSKSIGDLEKKGSVQKGVIPTHISTYSGAKPGVAGVLGQLKNLKGAKDKGPAAFATALIVLVLTIVGIFGSTSLIGQSITGNLLEKFNTSFSMFEKANNNLVVSRLFGTKQKCSAAKKVICDAIGVTQDQLDRLKENGVKFNPENGTPNQDGDRFYFDSVEVDGETVTPDNVKEKLKNPKIKKALLPITKPTSWVAEKNFQRARVKRLLGVNENPDTSAKDRAELEKKTYQNTHEKVGEIGTDGKVSTPEEDTSDPNSGTRATDGDLNGGSSAIAAEAARLEKAALAGELTDNTLPTGDVGAAVAQDGINTTDPESLLKQGWGWLNTVDVLDVACTAYQIGNTAAQIARTISLVNTIRYGYMFLAAWDKVKAGDASQGDITELMNVITTPNNYGESFDSSVNMQYLFTGKISTATPPSISTVGGDTLQNMAAGFQQLNRFFDVIGNVSGGNTSAIRGYATIQTACGLATNLAFQIGVTAIDWAVTLVSTPFTGGATLAANIAGKATIKTAFTLGKKALIDIIKKDILNLFRKGATKAEKEVARKAAKTNIRKQLTNPVNAVMLGLTLVENFGMDYIAQSLAGTDVLAYLNDSAQTGDAIVTARAGEDTASCIAAGCQFQYLPATQAAMDGNNAAIQNDIAFQKETADPLDINNRYSTLGSFVTAFATQVGGISTSSLITSARGVLAIPLSSFSKLTTSASAVGEEATAQNLSDFINNPVLKELNLGNDIVGNPAAAGNAEYVGDVDEMKLISDAIDQGFIRSDGGIIESSAYGKHVDDCNNPARIQVDPTLFSEDILQPAYCRDNTASNNYFNALTTYRSLMVDDSALPSSDSTDKVALAQKIIAKGKVRYWSGNGGVHPTLEEIASGKIDGDGECGVNINILRIIDALTDTYSIQINDINRRCEGSTPAGSAGTASRHYAGSGSAIDLQKYSVAESLGMAKIAMPIQSEAATSVGTFAQVGFGSGGCYVSVPNKPAGVKQISDNCGSLHLDVPPQSDPNLKYTKGI